MGLPVGGPHQPAQRLASVVSDVVSVGLGEGFLVQGA